VIRAALLAGMTVLVFGCASQKNQEVKEAPWTGDPGLAPPSLQQPDPAAARESDVSPIPSAAAAAVPATDAVPAGGAAPAKTELLGEMSDSTPGAANIIQRPCDLENCAVVLSIATHEAAEAVDQDDGGPGLYMPEGMYSAETAGQPAVVDAYGVQKIVQLWDVAVQMRDGSVQVIQQRNQPLFRVGDPVLVKNNKILLWN
jgi:hypothetical protein